MDDFPELQAAQEWQEISANVRNRLLQLSACEVNCADTMKTFAEACVVGLQLDAAAILFAKKIEDRRAKGYWEEAA